MAASMMERSRYRVTGGIFLVALAIIVLPMLLDGGGMPPVTLDPMQPVPDPERRGTRADLPLVERVADPDGSVADPEQDPHDLPASGQGVDPVGAEESTERDYLEAARELRAAVDEDGFHRETNTLFGEPVLVEAGADTRVFAVQVGSFAALDNATSLRDRLRTDGYEAFLTTYRPEGTAVVNRVAVGPLLSAADAESLRSELSRRYSTSARLMAFGD
jgi:cell division septation protein DedD